MSSVHELQSLLIGFSDGEWEHGPGIAITSIDNPGWSVDLCLTGTTQENLSVAPITLDRSNDDWMHIRTEVRGFENYLMVACGPGNLEEALEKIFEVLQNGVSPD